MLSYALWSIYKTKRDIFYRPFMLAFVGAFLIVFDNFIYGEKLQMHNIPSWIGNAMLIIGVIWSARDTAKEKPPPFGL